MAFVSHLAQEQLPDLKVLVARELLIIAILPRHKYYFVYDERLHGLELTD